LAVAEELKRHWIGVDNSELAIATTLRRFAQGLKPMGDFVSARNGKEITGQKVMTALSPLTISNFRFICDEPNLSLIDPTAFHDLDRHRGT
jgi:hypothetical protein